MSSPNVPPPPPYNAVFAPPPNPVDVKPPKPVADDDDVVAAAAAFPIDVADGHVAMRRLLYCRGRHTQETQGRTKKKQNKRTKK